MYQPPQTFLLEDSPPCSPQNTRVPTFQISSPAAQDTKGKKEHTRGRSHAEKAKEKHPPPFSYEYCIRDGQIAGLAEYNGASDYLHYSSSSRGSSRVPSRNPSTNASPRTSTVERQSNESDRLMRPVTPSPRKTDRLKRALSLSNAKGRSSLEDRKRRAPPVPSPPQISTPTFEPFGMPSPMNISEAFGPTPPRSPRKSFEEPRPAPQPPSKNRADAARQVVAPPTPKQSFDEPRSILKQAAPPVLTKPLPPKERSFEGPRNRPTIVTSNPLPPQVAQFDTTNTAAPSAPRPVLRRKTSKFVEHIETAPPKEDTPASATPPMPSLPPFDFQLPTSPERNFTKGSTPIKRAATTVRKPSQKIFHLETLRPTTSRPELKPQTKLQKSQPALTLAQRAQPLQPLEHNIARKRSTSNLKSSAIRVPVPASVLKRATSMRDRPPTVWGDLCMAEVKPVLTSPVVASGHARMISC